MERISDGFKGERSIVTPYSVRNTLAANPLTSKLYITHMGYYPMAQYHFKERIDGAPENILILCNEGKGTIKTDNEEFHLQTNQFFIIPHNTRHIYYADSKNPWSIYWIHFKGSDEKYYSSITEKVVTLKNHRLNERIALFDEMLHNLEMGYYQENLEYVSNCFQFFMTTIKYQNQYSDVYDLETNDIIQKSIFYMKQNISNKLTLDDLAEHVGYSAQYFSNVFSQKTSFSPIEYYNKLKIQKACSLLEFSEMKIKEIAYYLGFYDPFHFSKAFKNEMEISPKEFRKRYKTENAIKK